MGNEEYLTGSDAVKIHKPIEKSGQAAISHHSSKTMVGKMIFHPDHMKELRFHNLKPPRLL